MSFTKILKNPRILQAIADAGYSEPTPIQAEAIPVISGGRDLLGSAQTGTGKTAAFLLPVLERLLENPVKKGPGPRVLILVPTRELAMQVAKEAAQFGKNAPDLKTVCIYGGAPYPMQNRELGKPYEILVATPGRLMDHMERGRIRFSRLEVLVLDEADRMLDMGFIEPVEYIAAATPEGRQTLLFSATFNKNVMGLSKRLLKNPVQVSVSHQHQKHEQIDQRLHYVDNLEHKEKLLNHLLIEKDLAQAIIFTATKNQADELAETLIDFGHQAAALHGDMNQRQRTRTLDRLRHGKLKVLVATDVAARGIDVLTITHVINFDLPRNPEDYVHRIGRTGRAGAKGLAISFVSMRDRHLVRQIEQFTGQTLQSQVIAGLEPKIDPTARPSRPFGRGHYNKGPRRSGSGGGFRPPGGSGGGKSKRPFAKKRFS